jgi:hypothetical protein
MSDIQCEQCGYVDAEHKFIHLPEYVGDADLQCHSCGSIICGLEADWQARCLAAEAELATVKAALPKWRKRDYYWALGFSENANVLTLGTVTLTGNESDATPWSSYDGRWSEKFATQAEAFRGLEGDYGLPPCEVCDE